MLSLQLAYDKNRFLRAFNRKLGVGYTSISEFQDSRFVEHAQGTREPQLVLRSKDIGRWFSKRCLSRPLAGLSLKHRMRAIGRSDLAIL